jgi:hypothetical protein
MKNVHGSKVSGKENSQVRLLFIIDRSHDQDAHGMKKIANIVNNICDRLLLSEPFAIQGSPGNELLVKQKHLLPKAAVLVSIGTKSGENFSQEERELIDNYVRDGGHLFITAYPPEKPPNELLEQLGAKFGENKIQDKKHHAGRHKDHIIVEDLTNHPINEGVKSIQIGKFGCYPIEIENPQTTVLAFSSGDAEPPLEPIAALLSCGAGKAVIIGQTRLFQDDFIEKLDNRRWLQNIISYLAGANNVTIERARARTFSK